MSWLYSQALVEESLGETFLDGEQCAVWNGMHTQQVSWLPDKTTKRYRLSRSGLTFKPLMDDLGKAVLMSCLEAFLAPTSVSQGEEQGSKESSPPCGHTWQELSVKFDPASFSWKTHRFLWEEDLQESSVTLPRWGMMRDGVLWEHTTLPLPTSGTGSGSWPTPTRRDYKGINAPEGLTRKDGKSRMDQLPNAVAYSSKEKDTGPLNPAWVEWLMGWPIGWTGLKPLETDRFRKWPHSHGDS